MSKERVLIVHNYYQVPGGEDTVVANEKKMLEDNGHEVFMYTRHNNEIKQSSILKKLKLALDTIYSFKTIREVKKIIRENKIDIVHVHNTLPLISPSVYKAAKDCGVKVVQTVHNFRLVCPGATFHSNGKICEECISKGLGYAVKYKCYRNSKIETLIVVFMLKINRLIGSYNKVNAYIALTEFNKKKLKSLISKDKIFVKSNFTDDPNIDIVRPENREYFMFLGRIDKLKGINILLESWKSIKDERLIIVGAGPEENYVRNFINDNKISNIEFLGHRTKEEAMSILSKAKALIIPSQWYEGFPMIITEAFSLGVTVIASDLGNLSSVIENNINGLLFKCNDKYELTDNIRLLLENKVLTNELYKEDLKIFTNKYNREENYKILIDIYSKC